MLGGCLVVIEPAHGILVFITYVINFHIYMYMCRYLVRRLEAQCFVLAIVYVPTLIVRAVKDDLVYEWQMSSSWVGRAW